MLFILSAVTFTEVLKWVGYVAVAILCLMFMIVVHEFGHYLAGKLFHFKINEFSIGFGPKIFQIKSKHSDEKFTLRCIPLGGYCAFEGEDEDNPSPEAFNNKPVWQRIIVLFAGAFFNFLSAIIIISIFFMSYGEAFPKVRDTYEYVDSAYVQQLEEGDIIYKVNNKKVYSMLESTAKISSMLAKQDENVITVIRNGEEIDFTIVKHEYIFEYKDENGNVNTQVQYGLGISMGLEQVKLPFFEAIGHSFEFAFDVIRVIFRTIAQLFTGAAKVSESMGGTVTAVATLAQMTQYGFSAVMYAVCVLSASIGIMNLLPIPALDGSKIVFCIIEGIRKKPINRKTEAIIHTVGIILLFGLAIVLDLLHFLG